MKPDYTSPGWKPTLTLAKLYEEQNQFYDALAIYEIISQNDQSAELRQKIDTLQTKILDDSHMNYDPRIEQLFSSEELVYLKIMNHSAFENLSRMQAQFAQGASDYDILMTEDSPEESPEVSAPDLTNLLGEIAAEVAQTQPVKVTEGDNNTVEDLVNDLKARFGNDSRLDNISVQEFLELLKDHNLLTKLGKK